MSVDAHSLLVFAHVLLFVFWLGTDLGVFLAAKISEKPELSVETRVTVLQLGLTLDRMPRTCLALIFATGLQLAHNLGVIDAPGWLRGAVWALSAIWATALWVGFLHPGTPRDQQMARLNLVMNGVLCLALLGLAGVSVASDALTLPGWLTAKILAVGLIGAAGVALDTAFKPAVETFQQIATAGATPERNARYSAQVAPVYRWVLLIYALVLIAAFAGVTKPG